MQALILWMPYVLREITNSSPKEDLFLLSAVAFREYCDSLWQSSMSHSEMHNCITQYKRFLFFTLTIRWQILAIELFSEFQGRSFNFPKWHHPIHFVEKWKTLGVFRHLNSRVVEQGHQGVHSLIPLTQRRSSDCTAAGVADLVMNKFDE